MAKKQADTPVDSADNKAETPAAAEKPAAAEGKKPKAPKKEKEAAPAASPTPAGDGATSAPVAAAAPPSDKPTTNKKGRRPGVPPRRGKKLRNQLRNNLQKLIKESPAPLRKAITLLKQVKRAKFDETLEIHMSLGIDATQSDQMIRGSVALPHGVGKTVRVLIFCQGDDVAKAQAAGADHAGSDDLIKQISGGWLDFDVALATQNMMGQVSRLGKVLGPRGLMPTPKAGTVVPAGGDIAAAVKEFKAGKVEYRSDKGGNVHAGVGKLSFEEDQLVANVTTFVEQIRSVKPSGVKGNYVKSITISGTMTPGIKVMV